MGGAFRLRSPGDRASMFARACRTHVAIILALTRLFSPPRDVALPEEAGADIDSAAPIRPVRNGALVHAKGGFLSLRAGARRLCHLQVF